jgi:hypothetical protein
MSEPERRKTTMTTTRSRSRAQTPPHPAPAQLPPAATTNVSTKGAAALDWLSRNAAHLGEVAQIALAAGVHMSPQAQTVASIAVLLGHAHETPPPTP